MDNINKIRPFGRLCVTLGMIPTSYKESMSYEEQLLWFCHFLETEIIPKYNENVEAINDLINLCNELKNFVENYFDNLDVQEEINNKLDEMAESGELTDIIAQYLGLAGVLAYNTIEDLTEAINITNGSICYVLGQLSYNDGKGGFYKVRPITSDDNIDGFNIVRLDTSNTIIAERIKNFYIEELFNNVNNINENLTELNENVNLLNNITDSKFTSIDSAYDTRLDLVSTYNSLSFEIFKTKKTGSALTIQGNALNRFNGRIYHNTSNEIYVLTDTDVVDKRTQYNDDYGHGGDCCIYENKMYIADSDNTAIHIVDLSNGNKTSIGLNTSYLLNENHPEYVPVLGGICMDETNEYCYICIADTENSDHTVKDGSTVRIYKYYFTNGSYEKLFELTQDLCYIQGFTHDNDYFYFIGNKPFTLAYTGQKLYIIRRKDYSLFDVLENNSSYEAEGLDYCYYHGVEGLLSTCAYGGTNMFFGLYAFNGNCSEQITFKDSGSQKAYSVKSRGGMVTTFIHINGNFQPDQTYEYNNFFDYNFPVKVGNALGNVGMFATYFIGSNRNYVGTAEWDLSNNKLIIRTGTTTPASSYTELLFTYVSE